ncbi:MAG: hypothetical protein L0Z53_21330 [Acidobacteriales bacterium]|nr:hypothetical protein [Terriglobales bacterium]
MMQQLSVANAKPRSTLLSYFSLFTSLGTLLCCALPSLLVLAGLGTTVASLLSMMPWLVTVSRHKAWVFSVSGMLILLSFVHMRVIAPRLKARSESCASDDPTCERASRISKFVLWLATILYLVGFFTAYLLGPILTAMDKN